MINDFENSFIENIDNQNDKEKEIISFLLSNGISAEKSKMITEKLYYKFYNLYNIVNASKNELIKIKGLGNKRAEFLKSLPKIIDYYLFSRL